MPMRRHTAAVKQLRLSAPVVIGLVAWVALAALILLFALTNGSGAEVAG
jgi:hypothetical protein